jgi:branched-chain amino acid transport system permease protein
MADLLGIAPSMLFGQLLIGLINGACYAMLSLGLAIIFGLLNIINFTHGAQYMMGAFCAWMLLNYAGIGYWPALLIAAAVIGLFGIVLEKLFLKRIYKLDHIYGFLLTFGLSLIIEGLFRQQFGSSGQPYGIPAELVGGFELGFVFLPYYRVWVIALSLIICVGTWFAIERTRMGAYLRAGTENAELVQAFGINVPKMVTLTYGLGVALAGFAGVMVAPIFQVSSTMGSNIIAIVFAVVVVGGMSSIRGSIIAGFALGTIEGLTKVFYPEASSTVIFVIMGIILLLRPAGLFGTEMPAGAGHAVSVPLAPRTVARAVTVALLALAIAAPFVLYPIFLMKALCYGLFAAAFGLLIGYAGLMSFGHAAFFGSAAYVTAYTVKHWGLPPELGILAGGAIGALLGLIVGGLAIRRRGMYFAMITFSLAMIVYFYAVQAPWTEGEDGIQNVPRGYFLGFIDLNDSLNLYYFVLAVFLLGYAALHRIIHSPFGQIMKAIRENETRAISLGYRVNQYRLMVFVLSATLAGVAGGTKAIVFQLATLTDVGWHISGLVVLMAIVGGIGTKLGPVVGAFLIVAMENYLAEAGSWVIVIQGIIFTLCVLTFRRGIVGEALHLLNRWRPHEAAPHDAQPAPTLSAAPVSARGPQLG